MADDQFYNADTYRLVGAIKTAILKQDGDQFIILKTGVAPNSTWDPYRK
jgi:hypothetical protein